MISSNRSNQIYVAKAIAIFSVICAHMSYGLQRGMDGYFADKILGIVGTLGVPTFFTLCGYVYNKKDNFKFWMSKVKKMLIPLLLWGGVTFFINCYLTGERYSAIAHFKWVLGVYTWLYFITVLLMLYFIFGFSKKISYIVMLIIISLLSNIFTVIGVFYPTEWMTPYLNPLNWMLFFGIGILIRTAETTSQNEKLLNFEKLKMVVVILFALGFFYKVVYDKSVTSWNATAIIFELVGFSFIMVIAYSLRENKILLWIGRRTMFIFFTHMPLCGVINTRLPQNQLFFLLKPVIAYFIICVCTFLVVTMVNKMKLEKLLWVIGL